MSVFLVTWNLNKERSNYDEARRQLLAHLGRYPNIHDPKLETVWFLEAASTGHDLAEDIRTKLDSNDRLFVTQLHRGHYGAWIGKNVLEWIEAKL